MSDLWRQRLILNNLIIFSTRKNPRLNRQIEKQNPSPFEGFHWIYLKDIMTLSCLVYLSITRRRSRSSNRDKVVKKADLNFNPVPNATVLEKYTRRLETKMFQFMDHYFSRANLRISLSFFSTRRIELFKNIPQV